MEIAEAPARKESSGPLGMIHNGRESAGPLTEEMLESLDDLHAPSLYRYARSLVVSPEDAEDAVQEVFIRLARSGRPPRDPRAYLMSAVRRQCLTALRGRTRLGIALRRLADGAGRPSGAEGRPAFREGREDVLAAVLALPLPQREALVLRVVEQMTIEEIAAVTGVSANTAASRYRYAVARLRLGLKETEDG